MGTHSLTGLGVGQLKWHTMLSCESLVPVSSCCCSGAPGSGQGFLRQVSSEREWNSLTKCLSYHTSLKGPHCLAGYGCVETVIFCGSGRGSVGRHLKPPQAVDGSAQQHGKGFPGRSLSRVSSVSSCDCSKPVSSSCVTWGTDKSNIKNKCLQSLASTQYVFWRGSNRHPQDFSCSAPSLQWCVPCQTPPLLG